MSIYGFGLFCAVYALAVATPGPGVAAILARSLSRGLHGAPAFIAGFVIGDLIWFTTASMGLAAIARQAATLFLLIKYAGAAYLLFLAWKLWTTPATPMEARVPTRAETPWRLFLSTFALTMGNPKVMIFFLALLPTVVDLQTLALDGYIEIGLVILLLQPVILGGYAIAAARARQLLKSSRAIRIMNRSTGTLMASAAIAVATR